MMLSSALFIAATTTLSLCGNAAAATITQRSSEVSVSSVGTVQVLHYNNLGPQNNGSTVLLSHMKSNHRDASSVCSSLGEALLPFSKLDGSTVAELQLQLDYLVSVHHLNATDQLWVAAGSGRDSDCVVLSYKTKRTTSVSCNSKHPVLCTSSVSPSTDQNRAAAAGSQITIRSNDYKFTGYRDARSFRFLGIPFANPPVQKLRFMPPHAYTGTKDIKATSFAASCIQSPSPFGVSSNDPISEDCLYLNVFTPVLPEKVQKSSPRRPVAVYLYGGAFAEGTGNLIDYDGGNFASRSDIVIVTLNYRVGALGSLATQSLLDGSVGIKDQILALKWVQQNIAAFGGDPSKVTIFGQSAGGESVVALLSSSAAKGLFHQALVQSAPLDLPWYDRKVYTDVITPVVSSLVGCNDTTTEKDLVSCLQSVPATAYLDNTAAFQDGIRQISFSVNQNFLHSSTLEVSSQPIVPMVDDTGSGVIDDQFHSLLAGDSIPSKVPVMFTTLSDEAALYVGEFFPQPLGASQDALNQVLEQYYPSDLAQKMISSGIFTTDPNDPDSVRNTAGVILTESSWSCAQAYLLAHGGKNSFPSLYEVEIKMGHSETVDVPAACLPNSDYNATCHASDVLLVWGNLNSKTQDVLPYYSNDDILHSQLLNDVWSSFIKTGNPNPSAPALKIRGPAYAYSYGVFGRDKYKINPYDERSQTLNLLSVPPSTAPNFGLSKQCAVFSDYGFTFQHAKN